jgi:hypothetical protein
VPTGDDKIIRTRPVLIECCTRAVVVPAVDLDGNLQIGIGEIDAAAALTDGDAMLLDRLGKPSGNDRSGETHLEVALAGLVTPKSTAQYTRDAIRVATACRLQPSDALSKIVET